MGASIDELDLFPDIPLDLKFETYRDLSETIKSEKYRLESLQKCNKIAIILKTILKDTNSITVDELEELATKIHSYNSIKDFIESNSKLPNILDKYFDNWRIEYIPIELAVNAINLLTYNAQFTKPLLNIFGTKALMQLKNHLEQLIRISNLAISQQQSLTKQTGIDFGFTNEADSAQQASAFFMQAAKDKEGLSAWSIYVSAKAAYQELGFEWIIDGLDESLFNDLPAISEALIYHNMVRQIYSQYGSHLSNYHCQTLDYLHGEISRLDKEIISLSKQYLRAKLVEKANPPLGNGTGKRSTWTEYSLIQNEISKKQRFLPVRELVQRARKALLELKPCWMMSPLAVAQYLEHGELDFDICILDEASQMPPENAIGALVRSKQAMIVGDTNQLPPTSFFRKNFSGDDDEENEEQSILEESILEMANAAFRPPRRLKWHYRSRHSGLIQFSNHHIYNDDLVVFPSPCESRKDMGVSLVNVKVNYKAGENRNEAIAIVGAALSFMKDNPNRSLGIVTLNQKQSDLVSDELEIALMNDPVATAYVDAWNEKNDGLESFFIKNLENVQGDERDVIFIGTVYGPETESGKVMQRFGPISGVGGKRRLNVLFTRAKQQIVTFTSMNSTDILATPEKNPGAFMLKCWLEYSATGICQDGDSKNHETDSDFEIYVMNQIKSMGCEAVPQVGVAGYRIDIGVRHPEWPYGYILGVECDGATYHSSKSARERDRLREEVLIGLGWKLHRIWSTSWFGDPSGEAGKLRMVIETRLNELKNDNHL